MEIEYLENKHQYLIDGKLVPSVSTLVAYATGDIYKDIPEGILRKAGDHGTKVHEAIEEWERSKTDDESEELKAYQELKKIYMLDVKNMEQMVHYKKHFCGRYDIMDTDGTIWDIKTTAKIHMENLEWQIGLYNLALGIERKGFCIHIPKKGKYGVYLVNPKTNKECIELIEKYEQENKSITDTKKG